MPSIIIQGVKIHYSWEGNKRGKVLIFLHGLSASIQWWSRVTPTLSKDHRLLLIDLPGHGLSSGLLKQLYERPIVAMSSILHSIIDTLRIENPVLVGWSLGGMVSLQYVLDHPGKLSALILVDTSPIGKIIPSLGYLPKIPYYWIPDLRKILPLIKMSLEMTQQVLTFINKTLLRKGVATLLVYFIATGKKPDKRLVSWATEVLLENLNIKAFLQTAAGILLFDVIDKLHKIDVPTLIIQGQEDKNFYSIHADLLHKKIQSSELTVIDGVGHCPHLEKPTEFNKVLEEFMRSYV